MSEVKVNKISPRSGTAITLGDSGDTFTIPSGATLAIAGSVTGFTSAGIDDNATSVAITIDSNENVGIGTTSPNNYSGYGNLTLGGTSGGIFDLEVNGTRTGSLLGLVAETRLASITNIPVTFQVNNAEKMRLTSTGLGIGTSNPQSLLHVVGSSTSSQIIIENTDAGSAAAPDLFLYRNSSSPADNDSLGNIEFRGKNDNTEDTRYVINNAKIIDASDGTEDGQIEWQLLNAGSFQKILTMNPTEVVINEDSGDTDFRVESNANTHGLFVQGSSGNVGIGTSSPDTTLSLEQNNAPILQYKDTSGGTDAKVWRTMGLDSDYRLQTRSDDLATGEQAYVATRTGKAVQTHQFFTTDSERLRITSDGKVGIGTTTPAGVVGTDNVLEIAGSSNPGLVINDTGQAEKYAFHALATKLNMYYGTTAFFTFDASNSNLGINNASPSQSLDVTGSIEVSDGIFIGGTGTANKLNDYEEGTWTPIYRCTGNQLSSVTYNAMTGGRYTKVGQLVAVIGTIASDAVTLGSPSGNLRIGGLPFTVAAETGSTLNTRGAVVMSNQSNWSTNHTPNNANIINSTTEFDLAMLYGNNEDVDALASTNILSGSNTGANRLFFSITYMTDA